MNLISHSVEISQSLEVPAKNIVMAVLLLLEPVESCDCVFLQGPKGKVTLTPPFSEQLGYRPIPLLLVSHKWRGGQVCMYTWKLNFTSLSIEWPILIIVSAEQSFDQAFKNTD